MLRIYNRKETYLKTYIKDYKSPFQAQQKKEKVFINTLVQEKNIYKPGFLIYCSFYAAYTMKVEPFRVYYPKLEFSLKINIKGR